RPAPGALARHAQASHDYPTALLASVEAGERAMVVGGPEEAARHYQTALELYDRAAAELDDPPDLIDLVASASRAISVSGHPLRALGVVGEHLEALPADTAPVDRARLLLAQARVALSTESGLDLLDVTGEAINLIGEEESELRARLLVVRAWGYIVADDFAAARESADDALQIAARLDIFDLASDARLVLGRLNTFADMGEEARAQLHTVLTDAQARSDFDAELAATYRLAALHYDYGEHDDARTLWDLASELGRDRGRPWAPFAFDSRLMGGIVRYVTGDWVGALERADASAEAPPQTLRTLLDCIWMLVAAGRGQTDALGRLATIRERWQRDGLIGVLSGAASIDLRAQRDGVTGALSAYDDICEVLSEQWEPTFEARVRLAALALDAVVTGAASASAAELAELVSRAEALREDARAVLDAFASHNRHFGIEGQAWWSRVSASADHVAWLGGATSDADALVAAWEQAVAGFERFGQPFEVARCRRRLAEVLRAAGRTDVADAQVDAVRDIAQRLGARPLLDWAATQGAPSAAAASGAPALTRRELEILALVAEGRTNGQIAKQLFISTKTVSVHVSNILAKLNAAGRTEAAAIARRDGLL
ncbi:MAG TPA: response regulator transcription factor, partial [Marmoricola sp.]